MADLPLPHDRYDYIRYALDPGMDAEAIPDEIIASPVYLGRAEAWGKSEDTDWATRSGVEQEAFYMALVYKTAALLSPAYPQVRQNNMAGHSSTFTFSETPHERTSRLDGLASASLASYITPEVDDGTENAYIFLTTVCGRRA